MSYTLFLDDLRSPSEDLGADVLVVRNCVSAENAVCEHGVPAVISFDHDLGENEPTAMAFMWWLIEAHLDERLDLNQVKEVIIHSANPVGAANLAGLWDGFTSSELNSAVRAQLKPRA